MQMLCESYIMYVIQTFHTRYVYANIFHTNAPGSINHKRDVSEKLDTWWLKIQFILVCGSCVINQGWEIFTTNVLEEQNGQRSQAEKLMVYFNIVLNITIYNYLKGVYIKSWQHVSVIHSTINRPKKISSGTKIVYCMGSHIVYKIC